MEDVIARGDIIEPTEVVSGMVAEDVAINIEKLCRLCKYIGIFLQKF